MDKLISKPNPGSRQGRLSRLGVALLMVVPFALVIGLWVSWPHLVAVPLAKITMIKADATANSAGKHPPPAALGPLALGTVSSKPVTMSDIGQSGDMFGSLNALFAGLAFSGVALAAWFQNRTLRAQDAQVIAAQAQQRLAEFEPLFFQLVGLFRDLQEKALVVPRANDTKQPLASEAVYQASRRIAQSALRGDSLGTETDKQIVAELYNSFYQRNEQQLGPLFRTLYHTFRLVAKSGLEEPQKVRYANIARGLLGGEFLALLMVNCLSKHGAGFKPYVETFGLLKHLRNGSDEDSIERDFADRFFEPSARMNFRSRLEYWTTHPRPILEE